MGKNSVENIIEDLIKGAAQNRVRVVVDRENHGREEKVAGEGGAWGGGLGGMLGPVGAAGGGALGAGVEDRSGWSAAGGGLGGLLGNLAGAGIGGVAGGAAGYGIGKGLNALDVSDVDPHALAAILGLLGAAGGSGAGGALGGHYGQNLGRKEKTADVGAGTHLLGAVPILGPQFAGLSSGYQDDSLKSGIGTWLGSGLGQGAGGALGGALGGPLGALLGTAGGGALGSYLGHNIAHPPGPMERIKEKLSFDAGGGMDPQALMAMLGGAGGGAPAMGGGIDPQILALLQHLQSAQGGGGGAGMKAPKESKKDHKEPDGDECKEGALSSAYANGVLSALNKHAMAGQLISAGIGALAPNLLAKAGPAAARAMAHPVGQTLASTGTQMAADRIFNR